MSRVVAIGLTVLWLWGCAAGGGDVATGVGGGGGTVIIEPPCPPDCPPCTPGEQSCSDGIATWCDPSTHELVQFECDPIQGMTCEPDGCRGDCSPTELRRSYIGCEYWPTVTANPVVPDYFEFAVVVANTSTDEANITITRGDVQVDVGTVAAGAAEVFALPWIEELKGPTVGASGLMLSPYFSVRAPSAAYRLRSDQPVTAYQFSPLEYHNPTANPSVPTSGCVAAEGCFSHTNDASLLLPVNALGPSYSVTSYHSLFSVIPLAMGDFVTVTAVHDGTEISVLPANNLVGGEDVPALSANVASTLKLDRGDVVQLFSAANSDDDSVSGTALSSLNGMPFQVLSGAPCMNIPETMGACDHLEEVVLPLDSLGTHYVVTVPVRPEGVLTGREVHTVRIHAAFDATQLSFDPPSISEPTMLMRGDVLELRDVTRHFTVQADQAFSVATFMHGEMDAGAGDPSQNVATPVAQYRDHYVFLAPRSYDHNFVTIVAPAGATITLDDAEVPASSFTALGDMMVARVLLSADRDAHEAHGDARFGITVYGYGAYTSYMYPGGLDLEPINFPR